MPEVAQETIDRLLSQIRTLESQVAGLRMQVERLKTEAPVRTLADLHGIFPGMDTTEEEIDAVRYRFDWDEEDSAGDAE